MMYHDLLKIFFAQWEIQYSYKVTWGMTHWEATSSPRWDDMTVFRLGSFSGNWLPSGYDSQK